MGWLQDIAGVVRENITSPIGKAVEDVIQELPGTRQDAINAAKIAAIAGAGYLAYPYLTGAAGASGAAGTAALPAGGMTATGTLSAADAALMGVGGGAGTAAGLGGLTDAAIASGMAGGFGGLTDAAIASGIGGGSTGAAIGTAAASGGIINTLGNLIEGDGTAQQYGQILGAVGDLYGQYNAGQAAQNTANQNNALNRPWYDAGVNALGNMVGGTDAYQQSDYNKFLQAQGNQALERSAAAKGMLGSGNVLAALSKYNQDIAGKGYQDWFKNQGTLAGFGTQARGNLENNNIASNYSSAQTLNNMIHTGGDLITKFW